MINQSRPLLHTDFRPGDPIEVDIALATATSPHIDVLMEARINLIRFHDMLHRVGHEETETHTRCTEALERSANDLDRAWKAIWC